MQVFPQDLNNVQTLFGGKIIAEMDLAASMLCRKLLVNSEAEGAVTKTFSKIEFNAPAHVNDLIEFEAHLKMIGESSLRIRMKATKQGVNGKTKVIASSSCTFVAVKMIEAPSEDDPEIMERIGVSCPHGLSWDKLDKDKYF